MQAIEIRSTSRQTAECSDIVLREGPLVRLLFRPQLVENAIDPVACLNGRFVYQRKGKSDEWQDADCPSLRSLKRGEHFDLEVKSGELLLLMRELGALYRYHQRQGIPSGKVQLVRIGTNLARLLELSETELHEFLSHNSADAMQTLRRVLGWVATNPIAAERLAETDLSDVNALLGLANLRAVLRIWKCNADNASEEFWQEVFKQHAFILSQIFAYPIAIINDKAYVGGKGVDNLHGSLVDFLGRVPASGSAVLIEIKTPKTSLLSREYRDEVYAPSFQLSGAISQVLHYRETLLSNLSHLVKGRPGVLSTSEPRCVVIAGNAAEQLTDEARKGSFERIRERLFGVTVITYDELFNRVETLVQLLEQSGAETGNASPGGE